jgi:hypothetical protein
LGGVGLLIATSLGYSFADLSSKFDGLSAMGQAPMDRR